ncbi:MAG: iron-sulfur cluster assembly protein [Prevotellaceae bacterium]|jgi:FeS assembly SUF system protein|nr:iron-sulfur cluster assembly protein [Prevotellaceae bacterium]
MNLESDIVRALRQVYDPEIPVNIYDLGLVYAIAVDDGQKATVTMTLTSPNCPLADRLLEDTYEAVRDVPGVADAVINLTFEPPWERSRMTEEALLELGLL